MFINELVNKYTSSGHSYRVAQNLAAEEIVLNKIASSPLADRVTLKGGIVMYNLTKNSRRATQDIDFDFIKYSIDEESIKLFIEKMNLINDGIVASINGSVEQLHQEDYQGVRVHLLLTDNEDTKLRLKLDIGVHTYSKIEQEKLLFSFGNKGKTISLKVNPCEQIFAEKLLSLGRFGPVSTRYKDLYDLYYLIAAGSLNSEKIKDYLNQFLSASKKQPNNISDLVDVVVETLNDKNYAKEASQPASKWLDVDYEFLKKTIISYIVKLH